MQPIDGHHSTGPLELERVQVRRPVEVERDGVRRVVVRVPGEPIVVSHGPLAHASRPLGHLHVRVMTLEKLLEGKAVPRPDDAGGDKDRADLAALQAVADRS